MALQSSGRISFGDIRTELGTSSGSMRELSSLANFSTPDAISEFYGYPPNNTTTTTTAAPTTTTTTTVSASGTITPKPINDFTLGVARTYDVIVTSTVAWVVTLRNAPGFSVSPSSGSATTGTTVVLSYDGSTSWSSNGTFELRRPVIDGGTILDTSVITRNT